MRLDSVTNVVLIVTSVLIAGMAVSNYLERRALAGRIPPSIAPYKTGDIIDDIAGIERGADRTLLFVVRSTCHFCTESLPFYKRLRELREAKNSNVRLVAVCAEELTTCESYLTSGGFKPDEAVELSSISLSTSATPTLVLINGQRQVLNSWVGRLGERFEGDVIRDAGLE